MADGPRTCDECGAPKRDVNHWFLIWVEQDPKRFMCSAWTERLRISESAAKEVCGSACAQKKFEKFLQGE